MRALPNGILTHLFSDIEGSTLLARSLGDQIWADVLDLHRESLSRAFQAHRGVVVDVEGDGLFVVFLDPLDAISGAISGHLALAQQVWPAGCALVVRMGIHTGEAVLRGEHYMGQEVHRASRICSSAHGGQIVLSQTSADLVRGSMPDGQTLLELGEYRLKDLDDPQRLYQLCAPGLPTQFPYLRAQPVNRLPSIRSSFVGRDGEIEAIQGLLAESKLVTLTGVGGCGKTRLAIKIGSLLSQRFPDGVCFVDFASIGDADLVAPAVAGACGLALGAASWAGTVSTIDAVVAAFSRHSCLIILDNCEHLVEPVADFVDRILASCHGVSLLTTSREALGVDGERIVQVQPLPTADSVQPSRNDASRLFLERARERKPGFELNEQNRASIEEICRRLDGIPLAIEFAAARVAHMTVQQIEARLQLRFHLLTGGRRRVQRQQTLAATLDWSYELLSDSERIIFRRLAAFAGKFTLEAVEAVCGSESVDRPVFDVLASLAAKSLVAVSDEADGNEGRYRLLETVRAYAEEKLAAAGEGWEIRACHCDWYLAWVTSPSLDTLSFSAAAYASVEAEIDNLRAAFDWSLAAGRPEAATRIACQLYGYWWLSGQFHEGRRRVLECLNHSDKLCSKDRSDCHAAISGMSTLTMSYEFVLDQSTRALALAADPRDAFVTVALCARGFVHAIRSAFSGQRAESTLSAKARQDVARALEVASSQFHIEWRALVMAYAAFVETTVDDHVAAAGAWRQIVSTLESVEDVGWLVTGALSGLSTSHLLLDNIPDALDAANRCLEIHQPHVNRFFWWHTAPLELAPVFAAAKAPDKAMSLLHDGARRMRGIALPNVESHLFCMAGASAYWSGKPRVSARLLAASRNFASASVESSYLTPAQGRLYVQTVQRVRAGLTREDAHRLQEEGQRMSVQDALTYALGDWAD